MHIADNVTKLIGNTPLVRLHRLAELSARLSAALAARQDVTALFEECSLRSSTGMPPRRRSGCSPRCSA